jgi:hypothetical protein
MARFGFYFSSTALSSRPNKSLRFVPIASCRKTMNLVMSPMPFMTNSCPKKERHVCMTRPTLHLSSWRMRLFLFIASMNPSDHQSSLARLQANESSPIANKSPYLLPEKIYRIYIDVHVLINLIQLENVSFPSPFLF